MLLARQEAGGVEIVPEGNVALGLSNWTRAGDT